MEFFVIILKTRIHPPGKTLWEVIEDCRIFGSVLILTPMTSHFMVGQFRQHFSQPGGCGPRFSQRSLIEWGLFFPPRLPPAMGVRRESGRGFHKASDFVKALGSGQLALDMGNNYQYTLSKSDW
jgi:hypothetical protein